MITVGDITGHDMHAATITGQIRSMLRQASTTPRTAPPPP
ncbi:SpoIIE family protein phosphatase [Streptomyces vinaceus]